jgi:hypothetical protein
MTFMSLPNGRHPVPRSACLRAMARLSAIVTCAAEAPVIIVMTPRAYS